MTWSIASTISYPPFKNMIPISRLPGFQNLRRLVLMYFSVIPRPKAGGAVMSTSALPGGLKELVVVEAYPSKFLLEWVREVREGWRRLKRLEGVEVRFGEHLVTKEFDAFVVEAKGSWGSVCYESPVVIIPMRGKGQANARRSDLPKLSKERSEAEVKEEIRGECTKGVVRESVRCLEGDRLFTYDMIVADWGWSGGRWYTGTCLPLKH
ncbi:hypothetical protein K458DRAFT_468666 [Lentithecium fluviatile CBS 122367]|uniref:Uncharacterized protein n=1 Tax=Lentithecium fluviatile CBS 122367 TaxID=1168545 RepID=A0A6G1IDL4_9PLEO|nr:hypothetical protein K458DRAFT_468666 [Lentithecium fluviatile CBS 122367]